MKPLTGLLVLTVGLAILVACEDDPADPTPPSVSKFENLTEKWHVINNLQRAYNQRRPDKYEDLLDASFTFFPDPSYGFLSPWGRAEEVDIHAKLLDTSYAGANRCTWMEMRVGWQDGITWSVVPSTSGPLETWYTTVLYYDFTMSTASPDRGYCSEPGLRAQFIIRNAGSPTSPRWQLVEFRDDLNEPHPGARSAKACESADWSKMRGLYYVASP